MSRCLWFSLLLIACTALVAWGICDTRLPLGVPGEWTWERVEPAVSSALLLAVPCIAALGYMGFVWLGSRRIAKCRGIEAASWLAGLVAAGFLWLWIVQESAPAGFQLSKAGWVLYYKGSSGYFTQARGVKDLRAFLKGYEALLAEGDVLHIGTHPPGLVVCFRGLMEACDRSPGLTSFLLRSQPDSVRGTFDMIAHHSRASGTPLTPHDRAVLWLAALAVQLAAVLTVFPLYGLLRGYLPPVSSWLAASFWPATPALAVFLPKSDAVYPFLGMLLLWLWMEGLRRHSPSRCLIAGLVLWMGLSLSLALLPVVFAAAIVTAWELLFLERPGGGSAKRQLALSLLATGCGFLIPCAVVWVGTGMNPFAVWIWNLRNHEAFYGKFQRTYWKWLLVNPIEFAIAGGVPLALLAVWSCCRELRGERSRFGGVCWGCAATWLALLSSGKNMGEAARLWIVILPGLTLLAAPLLGGREGEADSNCRIRWVVILGCQLALTCVIVTHVVGFHVPLPRNALSAGSPPEKRSNR